MRQTANLAVGTEAGVGDDLPRSRAPALREIPEKPRVLRSGELAEGPEPPYSRLCQQLTGIPTFQISQMRSKARPTVKNRRGSNACRKNVYLSILEPSGFSVGRDRLLLPRKSPYRAKTLPNKPNISCHIPLDTQFPSSYIPPTPNSVPPNTYNPMFRHKRRLPPNTYTKTNNHDLHNPWWYC